MGEFGDIFTCDNVKRMFGNRMKVSSAPKCVLEFSN